MVRGISGGDRRIVAIVQARMGSTRLPGKVLMPLAGRPLLWHVVHRLRQCETPDAIVIATSTEPRDDAIAEFAAQEGIALFRGSETHVLSRFAAVASGHGADIVVRVNADAPLIDPQLTDHLVARLIAENGDYIEAAPGVACFHDGVDPMSRHVLDRLMAEAGDDPLAREHVSGYLKRHRDFGCIVYADIEPALQVQGPRLSVDTAADLEFFGALYVRFGAEPGALDLRSVAALYAQENAIPA